MKQISGGRDQDLVRGHVKSEVPIGLPSGDVESTVGFKSLGFRERPVNMSLGWR